VQSALTSINVARVVSGEKPWTVSDMVEASVRLLLSHLAHPESIHTLVDEYKRSELPPLQQTHH
jgi:hypothetical protein